MPKIYGLFHQVNSSVEKKLVTNFALANILQQIQMFAIFFTNELYWSRISNQQFIKKREKMILNFSNNFYLFFRNNWTYARSKFKHFSGGREEYRRRKLARKKGIEKIKAESLFLLFSRKFYFNLLTGCYKELFLPFQVSFLRLQCFKRKKIVNEWLYSFKFYFPQIFNNWLTCWEKS